MDTAQRTSDAALGGLGRGDAAQLRPRTGARPAGFGAQPLREMEDRRVAPHPALKKSGKCTPDGRGRGGRGGGDAGARAEVAIPAQLHGTVTGPEDPQSRASGDPGQDHREWVLRSLAPGWG